MIGPIRAAAGNGDGAAPDANVLQLLIAELQQDDRDRSWRAAVEILRHYTRHRGADAARPGLDALARRVEQGTPDQQRAVVKALGEFFRLPPDPITVPPEVLEGIVPLLKPALRSPAREVALEAARALGELDRGVPGARAAIDKLLDSISDLRQNPFPTVQEVVTVVRVIGLRRPTDPAEVRATVARLVDILKSYTSRGRSEKYKDVVAQVLDEMHALTGWRFVRGRDAIDWWSQNEGRAPLEWYRERLAESEGRVGAAGRAALSWWQKYIRTINGDAERLLVELSAAALAAEIPEIRADAVRELARLAARPDIGEERLQRAWGVLIQVLDPGDQDAERSPEVLRALLEVLTQTPPQSAALQERAGQAASRALAQNTDRDVRLLAVKALGVLRAQSPQALDQLYAALRVDQRDAVVAVGALEALARIGATQNPGVLRELNGFLQREGAREEDDPQRDSRLVSAGLTTLAAVGRRGDIDAAWPEAAKSVELAAGLLRYADKADPAVGARVRQLAVLALADLNRPEALSVRGAGPEGAPLLYAALGDPDPDVARYATDAVASLAASTRASAADRTAAFEALAQAFAKGRSDVADALLTNLSVVARADLPALVVPLHGFAQRLAETSKEASEYGRLARLLRDLPEAPPEGVDAKRFSDLRTWLAEALLRSRPGDAEAARGALDVLARIEPKEPRHRLLIADALARGVAEELERADRIYGELLAEGGDPASLWSRRLGLAAGLLERGERVRARDLVERCLREPSLPPAVRAEAEALRARAAAPEAAPPAPATPSGAAPAGAPAGSGGAP